MSSNAATSAESQSSTLLLPGWRVTEVVDEVVSVAGEDVHRSGLTAMGPHGKVAVGSAAELHGSALPRATHELFERICLLDAMAAAPGPLPVFDVDRAAAGTRASEEVFPQSPDPTRWQHARSNGVAAGADWPMACRSAALELAERDRILRSWYGLGPAPEPIDPGDVFATEHYAWTAVRLPADGEAVEVVFVVGWPHNPARPLLRGAGAADTLEEARARAVRECVQGLAFLWDEPVPTEAPQPTPSPLYHLDFYLWPGSQAALRTWLDGCGAKSPCRATSVRAVDAVRFVDLTASSVPSRTTVVKALLPDAIPLVFGSHCPCPQAPVERRIHPVP